jgi:hypothetical protein
MSVPTIPREEVLILLSSFGVSLPATTKIPDDELNKRLGQAFDAAQEFNKFADSMPLVPSRYLPWPSDKPLMEASGRGSMMEYVKAKTSHKTPTVSTAKEHTFAEVRLNVKNWGRQFEEGERHHILMDKAGKWGLYIHVRETCSP